MIQSNNKPLVSVCINTYNQIKYIRDAIDGALMQKTNFKYEILIGEDESNDGTREICNEYAKKHPEKIRLFLNSQKDVIFIGGRPTGRANMMKLWHQSQGKYLALCNGDDYWVDPYKLQKQVDFLEAHLEYAISFHNAIVEFDDPNRKVMSYSDFSWNRIEASRDVYTIYDLITSPLCPTASVVFRKPKDFIIPEWYNKVPSGDMALLMIVCGDGKIKYFDDTWAVYRKHKLGVTAHHKGDYIHAGRIFMYLRIFEHFNGRYVDTITNVIESHLGQLTSLSSLTEEDQKKVLSLIPRYFGKRENKVETNSTQSIKITFVAHGPNQINGPNVWLQRILPELSKKGHKPQVIFVMSSNDECKVVENLRKQGIPCIALPRQEYTELNILQLLKVIKADPPDVFVPNLSVSAYYSSRWVKAAGIPTIGILHSDDNFHREIVEHFVSGDDNYRLSGIVCVSEYIEKFVRAKGISGVEVLKSSYGITLPKDVAKIPSDSLNLVYTGRLIHRQKRIFDVIFSLKKVVSNIMGTNATVYGEDREGGKVIEAIKKFQLGDRLKYGGLLSYKDIFRSLIKHHVFVLLSDYEGLSISLLEAMGCGLVPICTRTRSGASELIKHNVNGLLVENREEDFFNAVKRLRNEKGLWQRLSSAARQTIQENYTSKICGDKWAIFIKELVSKSSAKEEINIPALNGINLPQVKVSNNGIAREDKRIPRLLSALPNKETKDKYLNLSLTTDNMDLFYVRTSIKKAIDRNLHNFKGTLLDIGCGEMPYREYLLTSTKISKYIGLDIENLHYQHNIKPDIFWDGKKIGIADNSIDSAMATEVLEHVPNIEVLLGETFRVLKPGGMIFFTVPFLWPLHDMPQDEYRYTPFSLERHMQNSGLTNIKIEALGGWDSSLAQVLGLWLKRRPMSEKSRSDFSRDLFPFYKKLLTFESQNKPPTYAEMSKHSTMITGLTGTAQKPAALPARVSEKDTTAQSALLAAPMAWSLQKRVENDRAKPVLAIVCPQVGATSETFIRKHIELLMTGRTVILTGEILTQSWFSGPTKIIPIQLGQYSFNRKQEEDVTSFLEEHDVTHILCEFGCIGGAVVELNHQKLHLPIYVHFHGQDASEFIRRPDIAAYYKWMGNVVSGIVSVSKPMAERLIRGGIPKEKIQIIHYGVVYENRCKTLPENSPCKFISVSRLVGKKGIRFVLEAFVKAKKVVPEITLDIIGDGQMRGEVEAFISKHALTKSVKLHGEQPHKYVLAMLEQSSVFIQHSIVDPNTGNAEGLPLSILEASAHGLPVISTFHEGIPEAIVHKITGFLVQERDCELMSEYIVKLANDGRLRKEMGLAGRKRILNDGFTVEVMINKLRKFIGLGKEFTGIGDVKSIDKPAAIHRVLFVNHNLYPYELSGTPISTLNNAMGIKKKGAKVAILIPSINIQNDYVKEVNKDYILYKVPKLDKYDSYFGDLEKTFLIKYISTIEKIIHDFKPEIVHINDYVFMPAQIVSLFSKRGAYVIRNVCNPEELCHLDSPVYFDGKQNVLCSGPKSQKKCAECFLINVLGRKKDDINEFELSQYSKKIQRRFEEIRSLYQKDIDGVIFTEKSFKNYFKQFISIPNEMIKINPRGFKFDEPRKDEKRKEHSGIIHIGFIGNFIPRKGIDIILKAFIKISYLDNFILDIYGSESVKTYQAVIKKLEQKFPGKIKFHGKFKHSELARIAATLDFALVPSYFDTFNRVVRELMYFGIPLIVTDFFGASIIENNVNGIKIEIGDVNALADSMKRILLNPSIIGELAIGVSATQIASLDDEIEGIYDFYKDIISQKRGRSKENKHPQIAIEPDEEEKTMVVSDIKLQRDLVSIVILTFNELKYTRMCIESIKKHTPEPHEIVFVDNASKDGTVKWLRQYTQENTNCKLIENQNNLGFAAGNNQGISTAKRNYILLLNNDVVVTPGWLSRLVACAEQNADIGIVGPLSNHVAGPQLVKDVSYDTTSLDGLDEFASELSRKNAGQVKRLPRVVGFCMLIKRGVVDKIGGLDARYGLGNFEDDDFSLRTVLAGYGSCIAKDCFIHHFGNRTFAGANINYHESLENNWKIFKEKWELPEELPYGSYFSIPNLLKDGFIPDKHFCPIGQANPLETDPVDVSNKLSDGGSIEDQYEKAQQLVSEGKHVEAVRRLERLLEMSPDLAIVHNDLGVLYYKQGAQEKALNHYELAVRIEPHNLIFQKNLADFYFVESGRIEDALTIYNKVLEVDPIDAEALMSMGLICGALERPEDARHFYNRVLEYEPWNVDARRQLEDLYPN